MLCLTPGRRLRWSPPWQGEDASVLFDSASGDFWVLTHATRRLLERVAAEPGITPEALLTQAHGTTAELAENLASLRAAGLLAPEIGSEAVAPA